MPRNLPEPGICYSLCPNCEDNYCAALDALIEGGVVFVTVHMCGCGACWSLRIAETGPGAKLVAAVDTDWYRKRLLDGVVNL